MRVQSISGAAMRRADYRRVLSAGTLKGDRVRNHDGDDLGKIEEIMIDLESGAVAYAVLSFGGFLGMGDKLFAIPWGALQIDEINREFILNASKEALENAPGFEQDSWPDMAQPSFATLVHEHYGLQPYWERFGPGGVLTSSSNEAVRERVNQPDLPEEIRRHPGDVTNFPGREKDADMKTADPSRSYAVNDPTRWTRK